MGDQAPRPSHRAAELRLRRPRGTEGGYPRDAGVRAWATAGVTAPGSEARVADRSRRRDFRTRDDPRGVRVRCPHAALAMVVAALIARTSRR